MICRLSAVVASASSGTDGFVYMVSRGPPGFAMDVFVAGGVAVGAAGELGDDPPHPHTPPTPSTTIESRKIGVSLKTCLARKNVKATLPRCVASSGFST